MIRLDNNFVSIVDYKKILKVGITEIHIAMGHNNILISGEDLMIYSLNKDEIILKGKILKVDFDYERL